ncbi:MAG: TrmH family RNA methyltransferase [Tetrasphaera sp.]
MSPRKSRPAELRRVRRTSRRCSGHLIVAPLWMAFRANLGTLMRTCDAVGACVAVLDTDFYRESLQHGDTLRSRRPCIHWIRHGRDNWIQAQRDSGWSLVAVELAEGAVPLPRLRPLDQPTVVLLGHEHQGVPDEWVAAADVCVEIPMHGQGASLNVAVAGSLVLYRLSGLG